MGNTAWKQKHRELGLCTQCSKKAIPTASKCAEHEYSHRFANNRYRDNNLDKERERRRNLIKLYILTNRCPTCGNPLDEDADEGYKRCMNCRSVAYIRAKKCR